MKNLELILLQEETSGIESFFIGVLDLDKGSIETLRQNKPKPVVDKNLDFYAALSFSDGSNNSYIFSPAAVHDPAALGEEVGHYFGLALRPQARNNLLKNNTNHNPEEYLRLVALEEYIGRYFALIYLNHLGIKRYNNLWSKIEGDKIILYTKKPLDAKYHFLGYVKAEKDFKEKGIQGLKDVLSSKYTPNFSNIYVPQIEKLAA